MKSGLTVFAVLLVACGTQLVTAAFSFATPINELLETVRHADKENVGQGPAQQAWAKLIQLDAQAIPQLLAGLDGANPIAANWIRSAIDAVVERSAENSEKLPIKDLNRFLLNESHDPRARRLAYELIVKADPTASDRLLPLMLNDPSLELRRDAVARVLAEAESKLGSKDASAADLFEIALKSARDDDQVRSATSQLKKLGRTVDLPRHFGFLMNWKLIGPFDNSDKKGFDVAYPPEQELDFAADYAGKDARVKWIGHSTKDDYGNVDLNAVLGKHMGVVAYAAAEFVSATARTVDLRLSTTNANKIWLNGKLVHTAAVYHTGMLFDQYIAQGELRAGKNQILLKICQNEQKDEWAQEWRFELRVSDELGTAVLSQDRDTEKKDDQ